MSNRTIGWLAAAALAALLVLPFAIWGISVTTADLFGRGNAYKRIHGSATYRIAAYDHFYDLCAQARTLQQNAALTRRLLHTAPAADRQRQLTNLQAQTNQVNELTNTYNADARKAATAGAFRASDLPYQLNPAQEITCTA